MGKCIDAETCPDSSPIRTDTFTRSLLLERPSIYFRDCRARGKTTGGPTDLHLLPKLVRNYSGGWSYDLRSRAF